MPTEIIPADFLLYVLLGGMATLTGPILGAFALPSLMEYLQFLKGYQMIIFGVLLVVVIIYFPAGLMGSITKLLAKINKKMGDNVLLQGERLVKNFGGTAAVNNVTFNVN